MEFRPIPNNGEIDQSDADENFATTEHGAKTISGENPSALLDFHSKDCTYSTMESTDVYADSSRSRKLDSSIIVDLGDVKLINYIQLQLFDKDSRSYAYRIEKSLDGKTFTKLFDYTNEVRRSWQLLHFETSPIRFLKLVGTRAYWISNKRKGYFSSSNEIQDYDSFDVVGLKAIYKTANFPKLIDGVIMPSNNVATVKCGANVAHGIGGNKMLNLKMDEFTCHEKDSYILLQLNQPYLIDSLRMFLGNSLNQSDKFSFCIETSLGALHWEMAVDKRNETLTEWQEFVFEPRSANYIKITGTQSDINFICTYFECPRNRQKPCLKRSQSQKIKKGQ